MALFTRLTITQFTQHSRRLWLLVIPILITQLCQAALGVTDAIMAGRVSALDLAAVSIGSGIWLPIFLLATGILIATTPLIGEMVGRDEHHHVPFITQQSLWAAMLIGVMGMGLVNVAPLLLPLMGVPDNIQPLATTYLHGVSFGFPALAAYAVLRSYCEALGRPEPVTIISIIGLMANVPLNYWFIHGGLGIPALGGAGCGVASALVLWIDVMALATYLFFSSHHVFKQTRFFYGFTRPNRNQIRKLLKLGIPIGISIFFEASLFSLASLVISPLGELAVAAHQVALSVSSQLFMIPMSIAMALTIMVSNRYGEGNVMTMREVIMTGLCWATAIAFVCMLGVLMFRLSLAKIFTDDMAVQQTAITLLLFAAAYQIIDAWQVNIAGILRGMQDTAIPMWLTMFCYWLVALPLGIYLVRFTDMGAKGFWLALVMGLSLAAVLLSMRLNQQLQRGLSQSVNQSAS